MFLFKGWQQVGKGTYWEPNTGKRIVMKDNGFLPANRKESYFKLPESYLLIPVALLGFALSVALPYGIGLAILASLYILHKVLFSLTSQCERLLAEVLAGLSVRYKPTTSFFSGRSKKLKCRRRKDT